MLNYTHAQTVVTRRIPNAWVTRLTVYELGAFPMLERQTVHGFGFFFKDSRCITVYCNCMCKSRFFPHLPFFFLPEEGFLVSVVFSLST